MSTLARFDQCHHQLRQAAMAEWLRRLTRNQMGSSRVGSNPTRSVGLAQILERWQHRLAQILERWQHRRKWSALSGNRTPVSRVAGENSTTEPTMRGVKSKSNLSNQIALFTYLLKKIMHCRGIEPRSPAWQARILPLNQQCSGDTIRPVQVNIRSSKKMLNSSRKLTTMGIEPTIFRFEVGRLIHWATRPMQEMKYYCPMNDRNER